MSRVQIAKTREIGLRSVKKIHEAYSTEDANQKETAESSINELKTEIEELKQQKQYLMEQTKKDIETDKKAWETEKQTYIEAAEKEGYDAGFKSGETAVLDEYKGLIDQANKIVQQTEVDYHKEMERNEEAVVQLAIHSAERIIHDTLDNQPDAFLNIVKGVLQELKESGRITIYLNPDNYQLVVAQKEELTELFEETKKISIYADKSFDEKSCIIEHPYGQIDASVDTQLEQIRSVLLEIASGG